MIDTREIATAKIVMVGGGGGGTSNYNQLNNKPSINGVTLQGNKTSANLNINEMPENPLATSHGGTGNADGYIRKGVAQGSTVGNGATAEGYGNTASGDYSHAEGSGNTASSYHSHAEGSTNTASAPQAHAEGYGTTASGAHSHAGGNGTVAGYADQTAIGKFNDNKSTTLFEVGNGADSSHKSNAFEVYANGDIVAGGTVSDTNGTLNAVVGNPSDTASSIIDKIKIGSRTYDTSAIKPYTATNITTSAITISIGLAEASALNGRIIAVNTGSRSGTPSNAWGVNILYNGGGSSVGCAILKSDGTAFADAVTANEVLFLSMDMANLEATIVNIAGVSGGGASALTDLTDTNITSPTDGQVLTFNSVTGKWGNQNPSGGNSMSKTRYTINSSSWSASANASGYYTYSLTLTTLLSTSYAPNVYISGASDSAFSTDTEKTQFSYLNECNLSASDTLVLYAKTKPTSTFYIYVEGQNA